MRITINLSIFFHDHRSLAKIFINKKMKCIKDLEDHITNIFKLKNFYLKCDNQYLPPTESVQILNYDDIVWAVPFENYAASIKENGFQLINEIEAEDVPIIENKKKKKKHETDTDKIVVEKKHKKKKELSNHNGQHNDEPEEQPQVSNKNKDLIEVEDTPPKPKKNKKSDESTNVSYSENKKKKSNHENDSNVCKTVNKRQCKEINSSFNENIITEDSGRNSLESSEGGHINIKSLIHSFEKEKNIFPQYFRPAVDSDQERRVNIVKTIIVSNKNDSTDTPTPNLHDGENQELSIKKCSDTSGHVKDEDKTHIQNDESSCNLETSLGTSYSILNELDKNVNKRRRRTRVRKRNRKQTSIGSTDLESTFEQPIHSFIDKPVISPSPIHVRFGEEQSTPIENEVSPKNESVIGSNEDSLRSKVISISDSPLPVEVQAKPDESIEENVSEDPTFTDKDIEECILKQPITLNAEPRLGDVIAFKILRISESYMPEVSSTVVGKVMDYDERDKKITFNIVYGRGQCLTPQGKFFIDDEETPKEETSQFQYYWHSLLEPRLIFP